MVITLFASDLNNVPFENVYAITVSDMKLVYAYVIVEKYYFLTNSASSYLFRLLSV